MSASHTLKTKFPNIFTLEGVFQKLFFVTFCMQKTKRSVCMGEALKIEFSGLQVDHFESVTKPLETAHLVSLRQCEMFPMVGSL